MDYFPAHGATNMTTAIDTDKRRQPRPSGTGTQETANREGEPGYVKKVILVGDSIRMGYEPVAVRELKGWAEVIEMGGVQGGNTRNVLAHLDEWVISRGPDIVHLNAGLHDMARDLGPGPENRVPLDEYRANLERILQTLQRETRAALLFALTTPVDLRAPTRGRQGGQQNGGRRRRLQRRGPGGRRWPRGRRQRPSLSGGRGRRG